MQTNSEEQRRDELTFNAARALAELFDHIICHEFDESPDHSGPQDAADWLANEIVEFGLDQLKYIYGSWHSIWAAKEISERSKLSDDVGMDTLIHLFTIGRIVRHYARWRTWSDPKGIQISPVARIIDLGGSANELLCALGETPLIGLLDLAGRLPFPGMSTDTLNEFGMFMPD